MIRINLLGEEAEIDTNNVLWLIAYAASVIVVVVVFFGVNMYVSGVTNSITETTQIREKHLAQLKEKTKEVHDLEKKKNELATITLIIAALKKTQEGPVFLLDDVNKSMSDRLWLRSIAIKGSEMTLEGISLSDEILVSFIRELEKSSYIERVDLNESLSVPLVQMSTYNTQNAKETRLVVRGEEDAVKQKLDELKSLAESLGMEFLHGVPDSSNTLSPSPGLTSATRRPVTMRPTLFAWESFEPVTGKLYTVKLAIRFLTKDLKIEELLPDEDLLDEDLKEDEDSRAR